MNVSMSAVAGSSRGVMITRSGESGQKEAW